MFSTIHSLLKCSETRELTLNYLETLLNANITRTQILTDKRLVSTEGLLFNLLYIMQQLNSKVKLSSVSIITSVHLKIFLYILID